MVNWVKLCMIFFIISAIFVIFSNHEVFDLKHLLLFDLLNDFGIKRSDNIILSIFIIALSGHVCNISKK